MPVEFLLCISALTRTDPFACVVIEFVMPIAGGAIADAASGVRRWSTHRKFVIPLCTLRHCGPAVGRLSSPSSKCLLTPFNLSALEGTKGQLNFCTLTAATVPFFSVLSSVRQQRTVRPMQWAGGHQLLLLRWQPHTGEPARKPRMAKRCKARGRTVVIVRTRCFFH